MHRCIDNCRYLKTSFLSPNKSRTELTPKFLDRSTPNSVSLLFHTLKIMEMHRKSSKFVQNRHLHLHMLVQSMKMDLGWCFWDPRPVLWMPDAPYKPRDVSIQVQNLKTCLKNLGTYHGPWGRPWVSLCTRTPLLIYIYIYIFRIVNSGQGLRCAMPADPLPRPSGEQLALMDRMLPAPQSTSDKNCDNGE